MILARKGVGNDGHGTVGGMPACAHLQLRSSTVQEVTPDQTN